MPFAYSISIKDLIAKYSFSSASPQINVTDYGDFMIDRNGNGINDTLVFELALNNAKDSYVIVINLFDKNGVLTNETKKNLSSGSNKLNITFDSIYLTQSQFNYSIKIYNSSFSLKYRKDKIPTQIYQSYEEGFNVINAADFAEGKTLKINVTVNFTVNGLFDGAVFLSYNNSVIQSKSALLINNAFPSNSSIQYFLFEFDNETIKKTHYVGNFALKLVRIGKKYFKMNSATSFYDYRNFATDSLISDFNDEGVDENSDGKFEKLKIDANAQIFESGGYTLLFGLYDMFGNILELNNLSLFLNAGQTAVPLVINGSKIYDKKLNGPYILKYAQLYKNGILIDSLNDAYITKNYNFNDFNAPVLPDLAVNITASDDYHYGINNVTVNITLRNLGDIAAFNVFIDVFDNNTLAVINKSSIIMPHSQYDNSFRLNNLSDFEISSIADFNDLVEEMNESNNAERILIKINKAPVLTEVDNIKSNETSPITINLAALDTNDDKISFSINSSKFLRSGNTFMWNTTLNDSGEYTFMATASDGYLNDSIIFQVNVLDNSGNGTDNGDGGNIASKLTVIKYIINDNGGLLQIGGIHLFINNTEITNGTQNTINAGIYRISETNISGYKSNITGDCDADGFIILNLNDNKVCTIINDDIPTRIITTKWNDANGNGVKDESEPPMKDWQMALSKVNPPLIPGGPVSTELLSLQLTGADGAAQFDAPTNGHYIAQEGQQDGYIRTYPADSFFDVFVEVNGQTITKDKDGNDLQFGNHKLAVLSNEESQNIGTSTATIVWETDINATSRVIYDAVHHPVLGVAPDYGYLYSTDENGTKVTHHSIIIHSLTPSTTYYYRTISKASPESVSEEFSFSTLAEPASITKILVNLSPAKMWIGVKNSDDVGTKFDLKAEIYKNKTIIGLGQINGFAAGSSGFNNAKLGTIPLNLFAPVDFSSDSNLSINVSVRIALNSGHRSGTARLWYNDAQANSSFDARIGNNESNYYLIDGFALDIQRGAGPKKSIDVNVDRAKNGNPFKTFGVWKTIV